MSRRSFAGAALLAATLVGGPALVLAQDASVVPSVPASMAPAGAPCPGMPVASPMASMIPSASMMPMPSVVMVPEMSPGESMGPVVASPDPCASPMIPVPSSGVETPPSPAPA